MRRVVLAVVALAIAAAAPACGGPQIPEHNGYKSDKVKPWKKPKVLKLDDKGEAKEEGSVSYPDRNRAKWFAVDTPAYGSLEVIVDVTPPGDSVNEDFDFGVEVLDDGFRSLLLADTEAPDAHEFPKKHTLVELAPGRYYIHLFLEGRLDTADYSLHVAFKATTPAERKSDFPAQVAVLPPLPLVPIADDTPAKYRQPQTVVTNVIPTGHPQPRPPKPTPPPVATLKGRIVGMSVSGKITNIVIGFGTANGAAKSMHGRIGGIAQTFDVSCSDHTCVAGVEATPDQIKASSGTVVLTP